MTWRFLRAMVIGLLRAAAPTRIMTLGDSITGSPGCWRALLWKHLQDTGDTDVDFAGLTASTTYGHGHGQRLDPGLRLHRGPAGHHARWGRHFHPAKQWRGHRTQPEPERHAGAERLDRHRLQRHLQRVRPAPISFTLNGNTCTTA